MIGFDPCGKAKVTSVVKKRSVDEIIPTLPEKTFQRTEAKTLTTPKKCSFCKETGHTKTTCRRQKK
jgi:hypothetical protein